MVKNRTVNYLHHRHPVSVSCDRHTPCSPRNTSVVKHAEGLEGVKVMQTEGPGDDGGGARGNPPD